MRTPKFTPNTTIPSEEWRNLLRPLLRECSYLPDPIAKGHMRDHVMQRFRRYYFNTQIQQEAEHQRKLRKTALQQLSLLRRANEGYTKALEHVLRLSYGRTGKRRNELLCKLVAPETPVDSQEVAELINKPFAYYDGWEPPSVVRALLKAQHAHGIIHELRVRPQIKSIEPRIPEGNSWGRPIVAVRRRNIRKNWYTAALKSLLPPIPGEELDILEGLISGKQHWEPPKRRKVIESPKEEEDSYLRFLVDGPQKGHTFREYVDGRPHNITRRFMRRLWRRIDCLVPRMLWNDVSQKYDFTWTAVRAMAETSLPMDDDPEIFGNVDPQGKLISQSKANQKSRRPILESNTE
ncbi:uncharacterized protein ASPGLDRAFT_134193 [Aspergillus glaucus CBS 516.65]|uniref:LYR motif-containing protein Cup1-like N-terminal domain-containing protein n=1 Tax=Aspergillus glaucus CBS 516.65 TaxID=1160497 RepID=A0A1L9V9Z9_ASPGL|nr:hypothetical protein ASPGLDRAFT_134193 [Aspergillus glaucus CBS 516.65]OJJ80757.1 hypothetical protein ASPGLDRAFT_134193 [Aspergillus glaucus CBS 516.65]